MGYGGLCVLPKSDAIKTCKRLKNCCAFSRTTNGPWNVRFHNAYMLGTCKLNPNSQWKSCTKGTTNPPTKAPTNETYYYNGYYYFNNGSWIGYYKSFYNNFYG